VILFCGAVTTLFIRFVLKNINDTAPEKSSLFILKLTDIDIRLVNCR